MILFDWKCMFLQLINVLYFNDLFNLSVMKWLNVTQGSRLGLNVILIYGVNVNILTSKVVPTQSVHLERWPRLKCLHFRD